MNCPACGSSKTDEGKQKTALGYRTFRCSACKARFNERTGTPFNQLQVPTDVVLLVVLWRLRYKLSLRNLAEMFLERGFAFLTRPFATGKPVSPRSSHSTYAPSAGARLVNHGAATKLT